jgi:large subunit ribosomal protein L37Ae
MSDKNYSGKLGTRYGRKIRARVADVEEKQRAKQDCPKCGKSAKRISPGIYECSKCGKFTGGAYSV